MKKWFVILIGLFPLLAACGTIGAAKNPAQESAAAGEEVVAAQLPADTPTPRLTEADIIAPTPSGLSLQPMLAEADIDMDEVVALLPPDAIPAILPHQVSDIMVTAAEAQTAGIDGDVRVIGVNVNSESHAFPLPFLSRHEIVNTQIGGRLLAVTW